MKKADDNKTDNGRRKFLQSAAGAGVGVAVVASVPTAALAAETPEDKSPEAKGYRLTQHILDYYKTAAS